ncbi:hypothetical protein FNF28_05362 [Cafeteria roenbergensis]|uniref:Uncharacterized protein n=1 Tax=Cafeteria roenbergensis TaxID=33653 RepID=A0A5A8D5Q6_CAFRO|nr:hypothetical protein FNF28_05362 [Cafeteria roenbergensis]
MADQEGFGASEVVSSVVVLRHGARAVSRNAFAALRSWETSGEACAAVDQWARHLDRLSTTGGQQMHRLGEWLTGEYLAGRGGAEMRNSILSGDPAALAWFSSPVDRVVRSGSAFWEGCRAASRVPVGRPIACPDAPAPMLLNGEDASDELTRPWAHNPAYTEAMAAWKRGPQLAAKASRLGKELEALHSRALGLGAERQLEAASPTVADATSRPETPLRSDGSESVGVGSLEDGPLRLYQTTYLLEVMELGSYPARVVAFGAFLLFELRRWKPLEGSGETEARWTVDVYLNTEPFPFARGPEGGPAAATQLSTAHLERIISDLPLESAQYLVGNAAPARPTAGYGAMGTLPGVGGE